MKRKLGILAVGLITLAGSVGFYGLILRQPLEEAEMVRVFIMNLGLLVMAIAPAALEFAIAIGPRLSRVVRWAVLATGATYCTLGLAAAVAVLRGSNQLIDSLGPIAGVILIAAIPPVCGYVLLVLLPVALFSDRFVRPRASGVDTLGERPGT